MSKKLHPFNIARPEKMLWIASFSLNVYIHTFKTIRNWKIISVPSKVFTKKLLEILEKEIGICMSVMVELAEIWYIK